MTNTQEKKDKWPERGDCKCPFHDTPKEVESWGNLIEEAKNVHTLIQKEVLTPYQLFLWAKIILQQTKSSTRRETILECIKGLEASKIAVPLDDDILVNHFTDESIKVLSNLNKQ